MVVVKVPDVHFIKGRGYRDVGRKWRETEQESAVAVADQGCLLVVEPQRPSFNPSYRFSR